MGTIPIARAGPRILARANLLFTVSTAPGGRVVLLEDPVVAPAVRGNGVGSALLHYAIDYAAIAAAKRITLPVDQDNEFAQRFYPRHGIPRSSMPPLRPALQ